MSLEYYLFCRHSYDKIIDELDYILSIFEEIDSRIESEKDNLDKDVIVSNQTHNKNFFNERKSHLKLLKKFCDIKISELCSHEIIEDDIDITPDKSQRIRYCSICEYTEK